jgi:hypothetical protein
MQSKPNLNTTDKSFVAENDALLDAVRHLIEHAPSDPALAFDTLPTYLPDAGWTCNGFVPVTDLIMPPLLRTPAG